MPRTNIKETVKVTFFAPKNDSDRAFARAVERFEQADPRWRSVLEFASARLSAEALDAFGVSLEGLEAGPAPKLLPFEVSPDSEDAIGREAAHMPHEALMALGLLIPGKLGFGHPDIAVVQGLITAIHRLLRIAKARP